MSRFGGNSITSSSPVRRSSTANRSSSVVSRSLAGPKTTNAPSTTNGVETVRNRHRVTILPGGERERVPVRSAIGGRRVLADRHRVGAGSGQHRTGEEAVEATTPPDRAVVVDDREDVRIRVLALVRPGQHGDAAVDPTDGDVHCGARCLVGRPERRQHDVEAGNRSERTELGRARCRPTGRRRRRTARRRSGSSARRSPQISGTVRRLGDVPSDRSERGRRRGVDRRRIGAGPVVPVSTPVNCASSASSDERSRNVGVSITPRPGLRRRRRTIPRCPVSNPTGRHCAPTGRRSPPIDRT